MHRTTLLAVGPIKTSWIREGCMEYEKRLQPWVTFTVIEIPASKHKDPPTQAEDESDRLLTALDKMDGIVCVLDERGKDSTSEEFAGALQKLHDAGTPITFVLGGAYGLSDAVRERADRVLRLSAMTLPHELCRLLFLEQLYRAESILQGSGYHH